MKKSLFLFTILISVISITSLTSCGSRTDEKKGSRPKAAKGDTLGAKIDSLTLLIEKEPGNSSLYHERAKLYLQRLDPQTALTDMRLVISKDSSKFEYYLTLGDIYFALGKFINAQTAFEKSIQLGSDKTEPYLKYAELMLYKKEYKITMENLGKAQEIDPTNSKVFFMKGITYKENKDTTKAVKNFLKTIEIDPEYYHAYIQLGLIFGVKRNPLAIEYYDNASKLNPKSIEPLYNKAMFYQENNDYNKAMELYAEILKMEPKNKYAHYNLGYIHYVYLRVYNQGIKHFSDAILADPNYAEAYYMRGLCREALGDVMNAKADFEKAMKLKPDYEKAIQGLNRVEKLIKIK